MSNKDESKSSRTFFLRLLRRKLTSELDGMGYPGGRSETAGGRQSGSQAAAIIDAGESVQKKERFHLRRHVLQR